MFAIITGSAFEGGFSVYLADNKTPFQTESEAVEFAEELFDAYEVVPVNTPASVTEEDEVSTIPMALNTVPLIQEFRGRRGL